MKTIEDFLEYYVEKNKEDLDCPRGPDGTSYNQRRLKQQQQREQEDAIHRGVE